MSIQFNRKNISALYWFAAGHCNHAEFVTIKGGSFKSTSFPAGFACIKHPEQGYMLFDTGYTNRFYEETVRFPYWMYAKLTPVHIHTEHSARYQLEQYQIPPQEIKTIIISHFHADHIAGLRDFPNARFICSQEAYDAVKHLKGLGAVRNGFIPSLVPEDFEERCTLLDQDDQIPLDQSEIFESGYDLFQDGSMIAVDVSGHAKGQLGLFVSTKRHPYFLCADAVWSSKAFRENLPPHPLAGLIMSDRKQYRENFQKLVRLHRRYPDLRIIPSHCMEALDRYGKGSDPL